MASSSDLEVARVEFQVLEGIWVSRGCSDAVVLGVPHLRLQQSPENNVLLDQVSKSARFCYGVNNGKSCRGLTLGVCGFTLADELISLSATVEDWCCSVWSQQLIN